MKNWPHMASPCDNFKGMMWHLNVLEEVDSSERLPWLLLEGNVRRYIHA